MQHGDDDAGTPGSDASIITPEDDAEVPERDADVLAPDATVEVPNDSGVVLGYVSRADYCAADGAPVEVRVPGTTDGGAVEQVCTTGLASRIFQFGICSCSDLSLPGAFTIDALDSDHPSDANKSGASIGTNGDFVTKGGLRIFGSLVAAGTGTLEASGTGVRVDGNVRTNAELDLSGANISFRRDLWINNDIAASGASIAVTGDVYQTAGHALSPNLTVGGSAHTQDFHVADPCACEESAIVDIAAIVADGKDHNHNADLELPQDARLDMHGTGGLTLDCGRFYFVSGDISGASNTVKAHGRTAIFIAGDLDIAGDFGVDVGTEGALDVFVSGNLKLNGSGTVGSTTRPAALRFYVAGSDDINIKGAMVFSANLYAPRARVNVGGADDLYGALFARDVEVSGAHDMHYDRAIMSADGGDQCEPPAPPPAPPSPSEGCGSDLDCAAALVCESGACTPVLTLF